MTKIINTGLNIGHFETSMGLCALPIKSLILWNQILKCALYVKLNDNKFIKVVHPNDDYIDTLLRYSKKGIKSVWLEKNYFDLIAKEIEAKVQEEIRTNEDARFGYVFSELNTSFDIFQEIACTTGLSRDQIEMAQDIALVALEEIKGQRDFLARFIQLKESCNEAFLISTYTGFVASMISTSFPWITEKSITNVMSASMISDLYLSTEDMEDHLRWERGEVPYEKLSPTIKIHADVLAIKLGNSCQGKLCEEMLETIKYHHHDHILNPSIAEEISSNVNIMPAIYVISRKVANAMYQEDTSFDINSLIESLNQGYSRGIFKKVIKALETFWRYEANS